MPAAPKPVTIRGKTYRTHQEAADDLKLTRQAIYMAVKQDRLDTVGLKPNGKNHGRRVKFNGKVYKSIAECARANAVSYDKIRELFRK